MAKAKESYKHLAMANTDVNKSLKTSILPSEGLLTKDETSKRDTLSAICNVRLILVEGLKKETAIYKKAFLTLEADCGVVGVI